MALRSRAVGDVPRGRPGPGERWPGLNRVAGDGLGFAMGFPFLSLFAGYDEGPRSASTRARRGWSDGPILVVRREDRLCVAALEPGYCLDEMTPGDDGGM